MNTERKPLKLREKKPFVSKEKYQVQYAIANTENFQKIKSVKTLEEARAIIQAKHTSANNTKHNRSVALFDIFSYRIVDLTTGEIVT